MDRLSLGTLQGLSSKVLTAQLSQTTLTGVFEAFSTATITATNSIFPTLHVPSAPSVTQKVLFDFTDCTVTDYDFLAKFVQLRMKRPKNFGSFSLEGSKTADLTLLEELATNGNYQPSITLDNYQG